MIKAIFFDIDGTLVSFKTHRISDKTLEVLHALKEKGIRLYISSGRHFVMMDNLSGFPFDGYICMNGGLVYDGGEVIFSQPLDREDSLTVARISEENQVPCTLFSENAIGMNLQNGLTAKIFEQIQLKTPDNIPFMETAESGPVYQYTIFLDEEQEKRLVTPHVHHMDSARWHPEFTDLIPEHLSKAGGIGKVIARHGITREEVMAFGDGGNDIPMLDYAGIGIAMGNASEEVRSHADYVTTSVDEEGIAHAVSHFGLL